MTRIVTIGADPEVFLKDRITGDYVSATGMFPGTKEEPFALGNYGHVQVDGHALEFNTIPAESEDEFVTNVTNIFEAVKELVRSRDENLEIVLDPVAKFNPFYFMSLPPSSKVLGCTPDFSGIDGHQLHAPDIAEEPIRTSSGHIHIGWTNSEDPFDKENFANRLAVAQRVNPYLLSVSRKWEGPQSIVRRRYYGRDGAFRPKPYGIELRTLDAQWLASEERMREVYRAAMDGFTDFMKMGDRNAA